MNSDLIEPNIDCIARALENKFSEDEIIEIYTQAGFAQEDIFLLLAAAKIIYNDRMFVPKIKPVFRRVE
jgi:hypothetical protein